MIGPLTGSSTRPFFGRLAGAAGWSLGVCTLVAVALAAFPDGLAAQASSGAGSREMRHFWHVFIAYAVAWVLIVGWIVAMVRRLRRIEDRLG